MDLCEPFGLAVSRGTSVRIRFGSPAFLSLQKLWSMDTVL